MEAEQTERCGAIQWVKEHKTVLIAIGVGAIGTFFVAKNWNSIKGLFKASESAPCAIEKAATAVKETVVPTIPKDVLDNLTGNKLTARALGDKTGCTAQEPQSMIILSPTSNGTRKSLNCCLAKKNCWKLLQKRKGCSKFLPN